MLRRYNQCSASQREYTEYGTTERRDEAGRIPCPACGKVVLLRENMRGWRTIIPTHTPKAGA